MQKTSKIKRSLVMEKCAIAFQKTSKTKRSLVWKSERDRLAEKLKNKAIAFMEDVRSPYRKPLK
ncbi:hypothetical protein [Nostoc sp. WHI]|uniref:hypothetical protein n=1 Tax=Nostoc sp. WHI TaxID=2650611 RepID=UPI0018C81EFE|nr:hypothetical protein [Nostoc sp. WHI]MBG1268177.1 hypothetical protein [Nostoc sp. WHI]